MAYDFILFEVADGIARITLNRPDEANAMHLGRLHELHRAAIACDRDAAVRAVPITGK